ncbi:MAG: Cutinase [Streptosporangiaceae bacterium]|nr:Cutinase [Streptosporangiaceae bacterium]
MSDVQQCPSQKIILAGYSQGAMVIHRALQDLAQSGSSVVSTQHIGSVLLLADPDSVPSPGGSQFGTKSDGGEGVWTWIPGHAKGDIPSALHDVTGAFCDAADIICDFQGIDSIVNRVPDTAVHVGYTSGDAADLRSFGKWGADKATIVLPKY